MMHFCIQNIDIAPERNERRLCRKGIESVRSFKKGKKKKKKDRCRKELFVALCSGFYLESLFIKMFSLAQTLLLLTGRPPLPPPPPSPALV